MKTHLLLITFIISNLVSGQDYCEFNDQYSINFGQSSWDKPYDMLEVADGKFLILGTSNFFSPSELKVSVCRLNSDGTLDLSFGENGRIAHVWGFKSACNHGAIQADGKILIGGYQDSDNVLSIFRPYVGRLNEDGSVDSDFGIDGASELEFQEGIRGSVIGLKVLENGKVRGAIATSNPSGVAAFQINTDGSFDDTFSGNGFEFINDSRVIWQPDYGKGLVLNDGSTIAITKMVESGVIKPYLAKFTPEGAIDNTFGTSGIQVINLAIQGNFAGIHAILDQEENIILGTTSEGPPKRYQITKLSSIDGSLVDEFGDEGMVFSSNTNDFNTLEGLAEDQITYDIYAVGSSSNTSWDGAIWKIDANGLELTQCAEDSMYIFPFEFTDGIQIMKFLSNGEVQLAGTSSFEDPSSQADEQNSNFYIPKFNPLGTNNLSESQVSIYPNPVVDELQIQSNETLDVLSIRIRNQLGQIVQQQGQFQKLIPTAHLSKGMYFIEITTTKGLATRKFIKK